MIVRGLAVVILVVAIAGPAVAAPEDVANDVASSVMSPFCKGVTLHDCPSSSAADLRARIEAWAEQGWSKNRIITELEREYGSRIRATPAPGGLGVVAWVLPGALVAGGLVVAFALAKQWTANKREDATVISRDEHTRIEGELAAMRETRW